MEQDSPAKFTPIRVDTSAPPVEEERMPLFYLGDVEYTGPVHVSAGTALEALEIAAKQGTAAATFHCLIKAIGEQGYKDLTGCPQLTFDQARDLCSQIGTMYFGQAASVAGK